MNRKIDMARAHDIRELLACGWPIKRIAHTLHLDPSTVRRFLRRDFAVADALLRDAVAVRDALAEAKG